jgi:hypothetical protein
MTDESVTCSCVRASLALFFSLLISHLLSQSTEISANHHPRPPPVNYSRHKHLKIGNPQLQTTTGKSPTPQTPQDRQSHNHTHNSITPTDPPPHQDRCKPPHPGRDRQANPSPHRANPSPTTTKGNRGESREGKRNEEREKYIAKKKT